MLFGSQRPNPGMLESGLADSYLTKTLIHRVPRPLHNATEITMAPVVVESAKEVLYTP